jgi:aromatic ring-cleaving dioxygenase
MRKLQILRWDDHRYYHQSRINQSLHLVSAVSFLAAYALAFTDPAAAGIVGWLVGMVTRQSGHIFFEPRGYDHVNDASDEHKESIKAGYNMRRKAILIGVWLAVPFLLALTPSVFGLIAPSTTLDGYVHDVGIIWLALGIAGVILRTVQLCFLRGPAWGLAWAAKIVTDPFHNIAIYWKSPLALMRGESLDPIVHDQQVAHEPRP